MMKKVFAMYHIQYNRKTYMMKKVIVLILVILLISQARIPFEIALAERPISIDAYRLDRDFDEESRSWADRKYSNEGYIYRYNEDGDIVLTQYLGYDLELRLPSYINGHKVVSIDPYCFHRDRIIKEVSIPGCIHHISHHAFYSCAIQRVNIEEGVQEIQGDAFLGCYQLEKINIPDSAVLTETPWGTLSPFSGCDALQEIAVSDRHPALLAEKQVLFSKNGETLICYPGGLTGTEYEIPNGVKMIGRCAFFHNRHLTGIQIPDGVETIGMAAFSDCIIQNFYLPDSVEVIEWNAFGECYSLQSVHLSENLQIIGDDAFSCTSLRKIEIPESVRYIGDCAFDEGFIVLYVHHGSYAEEYAYEYGHSLVSDVVQIPDPISDWFSVPSGPDP